MKSCFVRNYCNDDCGFPQKTTFVAFSPPDMYPEIFDGLTFSGVYVHEPWALLSNFAVAFTAWFLFFRVGNAGNEFGILWRLFILFIGLGATGGIFVHGFPTYLGPENFYLLWAVKNSCIPIANLFAGVSVLRPFAGRHGTLIRTIFILKALAVIFGLFALYRFTPAVVDLAVTYLLVIVFAYRLKRTNPAARPVFAAFVLAFLSGFLYIFKWDFHPLWFSHKDMVHVFVVISLFLIAKGILIENRRAKAIATD